MSNSNFTQPAPRAIGFRLGAGILIAPYIFSWFTLRQGFSTAARVISFSWMAVVLVLVAKHPDIRATAPMTSATQPDAVGPSAGNAPPSSKNFTATERVAALAKLRIEKDKVEDNTWYYDKTSRDLLGTSAFYVYLAQNHSDVPVMRIHIRYSGSDWIFFERILVKADEHTFKWAAVNPQHHVNEGSVSEWMDVDVANDMVPMLLAASTARNVTLRLTGPQFQRDRVISATEKQAIRNVFDAYHVMGGRDP